MENLKDVINYLSGIESSANCAKAQSVEVARMLNEKASELRKVADVLVSLARTLNGCTSAGEPIGRKTVYLKDDKEVEEYVKSKREESGKKKPKKRDDSKAWSPERRAAAAERMRKMHAQKKDDKEKRAMLESGLVSEEEMEKMRENVGRD